MESARSYGISIPTPVEVIYASRAPMRAQLVRKKPAKLRLGRHEKLSGIAWTTTARGSASRSHTSNIVPATLAGRVWCTNFQSSLLNILVLLSLWVSVPTTTWTQWPKPPWRIIVIHILIIFSFPVFFVVRHFLLSLLNNFYCDILHLYNIVIPT